MRIFTNSYSTMDRHHTFRLGVTIIFFTILYGKSMVANGLSGYEKMGGKIPDDLVFYQGVQGKPGVDFPVFSRIPRTSFSCKEVESGYYADLETDCQVFHICNDGAKISFLCPNGTIFQQSDLICEWWFKVNCSESPNYYEESAEQLREDTKRRKSFRKVIHNIRYNAISNEATKQRTKNETSEISRTGQLNGNRGQRKFNGDNSLHSTATQATHTSSEETQIPEESGSFYKNSQNTIQQVGKPVTSNPYPNHRETYSDVPDIKYFYTKPLSGFPQSTSPASPQTQSTNRFPLNDGKPFVVTTPRIQYNINGFQDTSKFPVSSTERFRYSPTVPPLAITSKPSVDTTPFLINSNDQDEDTKLHVSTSSPTNYVTPSSIQNNAVVGKISINSITNGFGQTTTNLPDHQIIIGHPKIVFGGDDGNKKRPDYQVIIGHPKIGNQNKTTAIEESKFGVVDLPVSQFEKVHPKIDFGPGTTSTSGGSGTTSRSETNVGEGPNAFGKITGVIDQSNSGVGEGLDTFGPTISDQQINPGAINQFGKSTNTVGSKPSPVTDQQKIPGANNQLGPNPSGVTNQPIAINQFGKSTSTFGPKLSGVTDQQKIPGVINQLGGNLNTFGPKLNGVTDQPGAITQLGENLTTFAPKLSGVTDQSGPINQFGEITFGPNINGVTDQQKIPGAINHIGEKLNTFGPSISGITNQPSAINQFGESTNTFEPKPSGVTDQQKIPGANNQFGENLNTFGPKLSGVTDQSGTINQFGETTFGPNINGVTDGQKIPGAINHIGENLNTFGPSLSGVTNQPGTINQFGESTNTFGPKIHGATDQLKIHVAVNQFGESPNSFGSKVTEAKVTGVINQSKSVPDKINQFGKSPNLFGPKVTEANGQQKITGLIDESTTSVGAGQNTIGPKISEPDAINQFGESPKINGATDKQQKSPGAFNQFSQSTHTFAPKIIGVNDEGAIDQSQTNPNAFGVTNQPRPTVVTGLSEINGGPKIIGVIDNSNATPSSFGQVSNTFGVQSEPKLPHQRQKQNKFADVNQPKITDEANNVAENDEAKISEASNAGRDLNSFEVNHEPNENKFGATGFNKTNVGQFVVNAEPKITGVIDQSKTNVGQSGVIFGPTPTAQNRMDASTPLHENTKLSYSSFPYNTITDSTQSKTGVSSKTLPTTESNIIKIRVNNFDSVSETSREPKNYDQSIPSTDSSIFRLSIKSEEATKSTNFVRNGFYVTKEIESATFSSTNGNTYLPKSTAAPPLLHEVRSTNANTYLPKSTTPPALNFSDQNVAQKTSAGVAQPSDAAYKDAALRPKPFELPPKTDIDVYNHQTATTESDFTFDHQTNIYVSSARPFSANTLEPVPTAPTESPTYQHVRNMLSTLREIADEERRKGLTNNENASRPGLVIPPSVGPQSLHSLAVYFANALDHIEDNTPDKEEESEDDAHVINELLTRATLNGYHDLFQDEDDVEEDAADITTSFPDNFDNDLEGQHSKNPTVTPRVRQLAQVFTKALSSYLDNPDTFKKALQEVRPTEPPPLTGTLSSIEDDELLNYSDADIVAGLPRLTTTTSVSPTWGYILAPNNSNSFEYNSLSAEGENLQSADSQSFATHFNKLVKEKLQRQKEETATSRTEAGTDLPDDHWTTSSGVTNLWRDALYTHPININQNLGFENGPNLTSTSKINYELRSLPKLSLNSTQVHGLLIDFMNSSTPDDVNKLHRILQKLNTTQDEFIEKMKAIEQNPITRRLILLLISECGSDVTKDAEARTTTVHEVLKLANVSEPQNDKSARNPSPFQIFVDPSLDEENDDTRALQLLNALYSISSKFGK